MSLINFSQVSNVESGNYITEDGIYVGVITAVKTDQTTGGTPFHEYTVTTAEGQTARIRCWLTEKALPYYKVRLKNLGVNVDSGLPFDPQSLISKKVRFTVKFDVEVKVDELTGASRTERAKFPNTDFDRNQEFAPASTMSTAAPADQAHINALADSAPVEEESGEFDDFMSNLGEGI